MRCTCGVAPLVGAWIEIKKQSEVDKQIAVAPLVGAWIEISLHLSSILSGGVAPLVGAWIEMYSSISLSKMATCRSSCRSVD